MTEKYMKYVWRILRVFFGCMICGFGTVLILRGGLGLNPWTVLDQGIATKTGLSLGQATQIVGLVIILLCLCFRCFPGIGTIINMYLVGGFTDIFGKILAFETPASLVLRWGLCLGGLVTMAFGMYVYISARLGAGPRDGLMVILTQNTPLDVAVVRIGLEIFAVVTGVLLGGTFGAGSVVAALILGPIYRCWCKLFGFDNKTVRQENILDSWKVLKGSDKK